jgi:hypothetical protein
MHDGGDAGVSAQAPEVTLSWPLSAAKGVSNTTGDLRSRGEGHDREAILLDVVVRLMF